MKKSTLSLFTLALFASSISAATVEVTTAVMDPTVEGSLLKILAEAPAEATTIEFNFDGNILEYAGAAAIPLDGKNLTFEGINKKNNEMVTIKGDPTMQSDKGVGTSTLFGIKDATVKFYDICISSYSGIPLKISGTSEVVASGCKFLNNRDLAVTGGNNGGVMRISGGNVTIDKCLFEGNRGFGSYGGGAICVYDNVTLNITNSSFVANEAYSGGAIGCNVRSGKGFVPTVNLTNCTFANNVTVDRGGALYFQTAQVDIVFSPVIVNCTFVGNMNDKDGGAILFWSRATTTMLATLVNNLFAYNYIDPYMNSALNDAKAFYLGGELVGETAQPTTVYIQGSNNLYVATTGDFFTGAKNSKVINIESDKLFKAVEQHPFDEGDPSYDHKSSVITDGIAMIDKESVAVGAGIASYAGVTIPATDQLGNVRPAVPSVGAVEYGEITGVNDAVAEGTSVKVWLAGANLAVAGIEGNEMLEIYNVNGALVMKANVEAGATVSVSDLAAGMYVAKVAGAAVKFAK